MVSTPHLPPGVENGMLDQLEERNVKPRPIRIQPKSRNPMAKLLLYTAPNSYAMTVHTILEETGEPYVVKWVEIFTSNPDPNLSR